MKKFFNVFVLLWPLFVYSQNLKIVDGKIFLGDYNFVKQKNIELKGKWEFYWNILLEPKDFDDTKLKPDAYLEVPGVWTGTKIDDIILPDTGYGTFRLLIIADTTYPYDFMLYFKKILYKV